MDTITPLELEAMLADRIDVVLVNVTDETAYAQERIPDSCNLPASDEEFVEKAARLAGTKHRTIALYGWASEPERVETAAGKLTAAGFTDVMYLEDGIEGWIECGLEVESGDD
jgi:rhodanese-related sulfurtransferase